jgi:uncharacterized protein with GYD domain
MGKYLFTANYTQTGLAGLLKEGGTQRRAALKETIEAAGGALESLYYAFGSCDLYITADLPDDATATAVSPVGQRVANAAALSVAFDQSPGVHEAAHQLADPALGDAQPADEVLARQHGVRSRSTRSISPRSSRLTHGYPRCAHPCHATGHSGSVET